MNNTKENKALEFNSFLILFGFSLFFGILNQLQLILKEIITLSIQNNLNQISSLISNISIDLIFLILFITLIVLFLKKKKLFLKIYIFTLISSIILYIYNYINIQNISYYLIIKFFITIALLLYFTKSKQVKQTFIN